MASASRRLKSISQPAPLVERYAALSPAPHHFDPLQIELTTMPQPNTSRLSFPHGRLDQRTTLFYGFGSVAYGVKDNGFQAFLLIFYNQVVGLPAATVGLVILIALLLDAMIDPLIGVASDNTRTRWGRRHPWMYASAIPVAIGWLLLWNPPSGSQALEIFWLFATAVIVRSAVSAYEVPSSALIPELTKDYDDRTRLVAWRYLFGWTGGLLMLIAAYTLFLVPTPGQPNGLLNRDGYFQFAIAGAIVMMVAILVSALATQGHATRAALPDAQRQSPATVLRELFETLRNKAFAMLMIAGLFAYASQGLSFALSNYLYTFVWRLTSGTFLWIGLVLFVGVLIAFLIAPKLTQALGKPRAACLMMAIAPVFGQIPYAVRLGGWAPYDAPYVIPMLFAAMIANVACGVSALMTGTSMMADVVEHSQTTTGRRSEGVFFSGNLFIQKATGGLGIFLAGGILALVNFPAGAVPGEVAENLLNRLIILLGVASLLLSWVAAFAYLKFPFGRDDHFSMLGKL